MTSHPSDTIVAQVTAPGTAGVGIVRLSGPHVLQACELILGQTLSPRKAHYIAFNNQHGEAIDQGIALYFKAPHSFTGEDVLELQGHGGQIVLDMLIKAALSIPSVRTARPGEFSERAFLNDKLDLAQAEAIADLISANTEQAARSALRSLQGDFSKRVNELTEQITQLRIYVEAAIDFPDEEVDFLSDGKIAGSLAAILAQTQQTLAQAKQGSLLREGMQVVIAGRPNAGKSSLMNALSGKESAIVTDIAGTTRDVLREHIHIDGMPLHIIDTAGLRESPDKVEQIGIERAWQEIAKADQILMMVDSNDTQAQAPADIWPEFVHQLPEDIGITVVRNKADLSQETIGQQSHNGTPVITLSAATGQGIEQLQQHLKECMGYQASSEGQFIARRRHIEALETAQTHLHQGEEQLLEYLAGELLAEELRLAQQALCEITGEFTSDDLLGRIFSSFCIGK